MLCSGGVVTVFLGSVSIGSGSVSTQLPGRRRLLALESLFTIPITIPAGTPSGAPVKSYVDPPDLHLIVTDSTPVRSTISLAVHELYACNRAPGIASSASYANNAS